MRKILGILLLILSPVLCVAGFVVMSASMSAIREMMDTAARQGVSQSDVASVVLLGYVGQLASLAAVPAAGLLAWVTGLLGYVIYPPAGPESPAWRKILDVLALLGGALLILAMIGLILLATLAVLQSDPNSVRLSGPGYLISLAFSVLLLALGWAGARNGLRNLRSRK